MNPRSLTERVYRAISRTVLASPIARWPLASNAMTRVGYLSRRWLHLVPSRENIALVHGHKMWFGPGSECYLEMTRGTWEPGVTYLFESFLQPGMVVVDAGAHIGYFTLLAARKVGPTGKVFAFEPVPANYSLLVRNIELNGYQNVVPVQKAVSNKTGVSRIFLAPDSVGHSFHPETLGKRVATMGVETTTLDRFFEGEGWPPVHLVKLDIEGAEPAALEGMSGLLGRNCAVRLVVEYIPLVLRRVGENPYQFLEKISLQGFTIQILSPKGSTQPLSEKLVGKPGFCAELLCERDLFHCEQKLPSKSPPIL